ncbi:MAG: hypothetical protein QOI38_1016, partial [Sphingomonadales bacterium]|nr:hypothetical protein [Sphingomonadales bacterium]
MARKASSRGRSGGSGGSGGSGNKSGKDGESILGDALRDAGRRAAELAQNPVARSLLAAG